MSTLSVPLTPELEGTVNLMVKRGLAATKAGAVRKAIQFLAEEEAVMAVLQSEQEMRQGKVLRGDLKKLVKKL